MSLKRTNIGANPIREAPSSNKEKYLSNPMLLELIRDQVISLSISKIGIKKAARLHLDIGN
jgi:hypothetical protein